MTTRYSVTFIEEVEHTVYVQLEVEDPKKAENIAKRCILDGDDKKPKTWPLGVYDYWVEGLGMTGYPDVRVEDDMPDGLDSPR